MSKKNKSENVQVILRVRPLNSKERDRGAKDVTTLHISEGGIQIAGAGVDERVWTFDAVYTNAFSQRDVYLQSIHSVVETVLQGYNATIFAYGQSGTGKTYSMCGNLDVPEQQGIIPHALNHIFETIHGNATDKMEYSVMASFVELYNGKCRDLLVDGRMSLELKENAQKLFYVKDLSLWDVKTTRDAMALMEGGLTRREVKSTELNADSSRSHSLFSIYVRCHDKVNDLRTESKLILVDLAGSERLAKTGATGEAAVEGNNINLSLTALGTVIDCLVKAKPHIPYRSTPLTMLLKDGLGGNSRTVIVGTCSPSDFNSSETVSTLRFLDRAKQIKNKPKVQMDPKDAKINELMEEIKMLKARLGITNDAGGEEGAEGEGADPEQQQRYIRSFDEEVENLKRKVEELQVQLEQQSDTVAAATSTAAAFAAKEAKLMQDFKKREEELEKQIQDAKDETALQQATSQVVGSDIAFERLASNAASFIQSLDQDRQWHAPSAHADPMAVVEALSQGFRLLQTGGAETRLNQVMLARKASLATMGTGASPSHKDAQAAAPAAGGAGSNFQPASNALAAAAFNDSRKQAATPNPDDEFPDPSGKKKDKKHHKKGAKGKKSPEVEKIAALVPDDVVTQSLIVAGLPNNEAAINAVMTLLDKQRQMVYDAFRQRLTEQDANDVAKSPADIAELASAFAQVSDELTRTNQIAAKTKAALTKAKEIADKRAEEIEKLKSHVEALREELAAQHTRHAGEIALQVDNLIVQQNKKTEQLMQKHQKALIKEKKGRDELQKRISELEDVKLQLEQQVDVKIMEYEALQQNYEAAKIEHLKKVRDMSQGERTYFTGGAQIDPNVERLRNAVAKSMAGQPSFAGVNTTYNARANDGRVQSRSAPEGVGLSASAEGPLPTLGSGAGPRAPIGAPGGTTFSRNFLDVPRQ